MRTICEAKRHKETRATEVGSYHQIVLTQNTAAGQLDHLGTVQAKAQQVFHAAGPCPGPDRRSRGGALRDRRSPPYAAYLPPRVPQAASGGRGYVGKGVSSLTGTCAGRAFRGSGRGTPRLSSIANSPGRKARRGLLWPAPAAERGRLRPPLAHGLLGCGPPLGIAWA